MKITKPICVERCDECPFGVVPYEAFWKRRCTKENRYLDVGDLPIPAWCPLDDVPEESDMTHIEVSQETLKKITSGPGKGWIVSATDLLWAEAEETEDERH